MRRTMFALLDDLPEKTVKNVKTQKRQLSSSESGNSNDDTEVQKPQRQKVRQA